MDDGSQTAGVASKQGRQARGPPDGSRIEGGNQSRPQLPAPQT